MNEIEFLTSIGLPPVTVKPKHKGRAKAHYGILAIANSERVWLKEIDYSNHQPGDKTKYTTKRWCFESKEKAKLVRKELIAKFKS